MHAAMPDHEPGAATGMRSEGNDRPWPVPPAPEDAVAEDTFWNDALAAPSGSGRTAFRIVLLLGALGVVTAAGVVVGRSVEPSTTTPAVTSVSTTTAAAPPVQPPKPAPKPKAVPPVTVRWGPLRARSVGHLPAGGGAAGAALVKGTLVVVGGTGSARILAGPPDGRLTVVGALVAPRQSMALFPSGGKLWALGGETAGKPAAALFRIDLAAGRERAAGTFEEPLAEAGVAPSGSSVYLVGGWTGTQFASAVLQFTPPGTVRLVARLPEGVRSPAVALLGHTLYVAGGVTAAGRSSAVEAVDVDTGSVATLGQLPQPVEAGVLLAVRGKVFLVGGTTTRGRASGAVIAIDPTTGSSSLVGRLKAPLVGAAAVPAGARPLVVDAPSGTVYRVS